LFFQLQLPRSTSIGEAPGNGDHPASYFFGMAMMMKLLLQQQHHHHHHPNTLVHFLPP